MLFSEQRMMVGERRDWRRICGAVHFRPGKLGNDK
jgi:hypothetical protein